MTLSQLLLISPVTLPLLNVQLPILGFYIFVPWLFLLAHFNLLLQLFLMSHKLRVFAQAADVLPTEEAAPLRERLIDFPAVQMLAHLQYDRLIQWLLALVVWITVLILPLGLLLWAQIRFLPYHNADITWGHRAAVLLDALMLLFFWPRLISGHGAFGGWRKRRTLEQQGYSRVKSGTGVVLLGVVAITLALSWLVATVPAEPWETWLLAHIPARLVATVPEESWEAWLLTHLLRRPAPSYPTFLLFESKYKMLSRNLDLREQLLATNELSADVQYALRKGTAQQQEQALQKVQGLNLQGRDLRYASLASSLLPEADLRGAQLQGADLKGAWLPGANLEEAQLQSANLEKVQLQRAFLTRAQLPGAFLEEAQLQRAILGGADLGDADLMLAQLSGANLMLAQLSGANLMLAQLSGANLREARLPGADLEQAQLQGAALRGAQLQGAALREASIGGALFQDARLDLADLRHLDLSAVNRESYKTFQSKLEERTNIPEIRKDILERLEKVIDQPGTLDGIASATQCLSDASELLSGCFTESKIADYLKVQADYVVKQVACSTIDTANS